jgi:SAM-dependent methyltransferase
MKHFLTRIFYRLRKDVNHSKSALKRSKLADSIIRFNRGIVRPYLTRHTNYYPVNRINICSGSQKIPGYCGIDIRSVADIAINLAERGLPFRDNSIDTIICTSGINYFTRARGQYLIQEAYRVLKPAGIARFSVQDMESIARRYVEKDIDFFFQKFSDGRERFEGPTIGDKFAAWLYGYVSVGGPTRYFYDFDSLAYLFKQARFSVIERRGYCDSRLPEIDLIDNRPDQMFFLEAIK